MRDVKQIPGYSRYGITSGGELYNLETGKRLSTTPSARGYHQTVLVNDSGERKGVKRHRLVALAHLGEPESDELVVNHKNLIPGDDREDNLEWCTSKHNTKHWVENDGFRERVSIDVLDVSTGTVTTYATATECAQAMGLCRQTILDRVRRGSGNIWPEGKRYRMAGHNEGWSEDTTLISKDRSKQVSVKDLVTGEVTVFEKMSDTLPLFGSALSTVWQWANDPSQPVISGFYQIRQSDAKGPWREVGDLFDEFEKCSHKKIVIVTDANWENACSFESATSCARANSLMTTALNYRLKSKGSKVFLDGKRYCYYSELPEHRKESIRYEVLRKLAGRRNLRMCSTAIESYSDEIVAE